MIKAVVFDMDGVLIDAKDWHYIALNQALDHFGFTISRNEHLTIFDGMPTREKLALLSRERGLPTKLHKFINQLKQQFTMQITHNKCYPNFIHENLLSSLRADGYKLAVASNAVKNSVETMMRLACLDGYLDFMFSNEDVKAGKPDPEIYNLAIQSLKLSADEVVIVEDNFHGIEAAKKSGAHVLEVDSIEDVNIDNVYNFIQQVSNT
tara:strand:+ start:581 stop:1204 length:624 start_codon:yes stop_codon:yes gene_type:complete